MMRLPPVMPPPRRTRNIDTDRTGQLPHARALDLVEEIDAADFLLENERTLRISREQADRVAQVAESLEPRAKMGSFAPVALDCAPQMPSFPRSFAAGAVPPIGAPSPVRAGGSRAGSVAMIAGAGLLAVLVVAGAVVARRSPSSFSSFSSASSPAVVSPREPKTAEVAGANGTILEPRFEAAGAVPVEAPNARPHVGARPTAPAAPSAPAAAPAPAPSPAETVAASAPAPAPTTGTVRVGGSSVTIVVDHEYRRVRNGAVTVSCGPHRIRVGLGGEKSVTVPCGGSVSLD